MPDNAIWAVTGPEHDARMARELAWIATGGQTGIVGPESLEVRAQNTPNNTVRIMPGGMSISATSQQAAIGYTSAPWQSYMRAIYQSIDVEIDQTGSSGGRTDVVGVVVDDPEFEGTSPDVDSHQYWRPHVVRNAGNNATRPEHFASLGRPFLPLAQVRIPSSTATITNSIITDIRRMSVFRSETHELQDVVNTDSQDLVIPASQTSWQTVYANSHIPTPQWAGNRKIAMRLGPVHTRQGAAEGDFRVRIRAMGGAWWYTRTVPFSEPDHREQTGGSTRFYLHTVGTFAIAPQWAGGEMEFDLQIRRKNAGARPGEFVITGTDRYLCHVEGRLTFEEAPRRHDTE